MYPFTHKSPRTHRHGLRAGSNCRPTQSLVIVMESNMQKYTFLNIYIYFCIMFFLWGLWGFFFFFLLIKIPVKMKCTTETFSSEFMLLHLLQDKDLHYSFVITLKLCFSSVLELCLSLPKRLAESLTDDKSKPRNDALLLMLNFNHS